MTPARGWVPAERGGSEPVERRSVALVVAVTVGCLLLLAASAVATPAVGAVDSGPFQSENDTEPPVLAGGEAVNVTAIELTFTDDANVDESSIDAADVQLERGSVENVTVTEQGSNASAILHLADPVNKDEILVAVTDGSDIQDASGNVIDTSSEFVGTVVSGMDGVPPGVGTYEVTAEAGGTFSVTVGTNEGLSAINATVTGPERAHLDWSDFDRTSSLSQYAATVSVSTDGNYTVRLDNVTDDAGNRRPVGRTGDVAVDATPPTVVAGIDFQASDGRQFTFDGSRSWDAGAIARHTWVFEDGTNVTGERVTHQFGPGNHTVRLVAVDGAGNVGTDDLVLTLPSDNATATTGNGATVAVRRAGGNVSDTAQVDVTGATADQPVDVGSVDGIGAPLAAGDGFAFEGVTLTTEANATYGLAVAAEQPSAVADLHAATRASPIGGLTVVHDVDDSTVSSAEFTFSVEAATLDEVNTAPDSVVVYRFSDGDWTELPTEQLNGSTDEYRFRATAPGMSRFAIGVQSSEDTGDPAPEEDVVVTAASLNETTIEPGDAAVVDATVSNRGEETANVTVVLTFDGDTVATEMVRVASGQDQNVTFRHAVNEAGEYTISVDGTSAGTLTVGDPGGDGSLFGSVLGTLAGLLGVLPLGLLKTLATFVGVPLLFLFLALKGLAIYLGY